MLCAEASSRKKSKGAATPALSFVLPLIISSFLFLLFFSFLLLRSLSSSRLRSAVRRSTRLYAAPDASSERSREPPEGDRRNTSHTYTYMYAYICTYRPICSRVGACVSFLSFLGLGSCVSSGGLCVVWVYTHYTYRCTDSRWISLYGCRSTYA